MRIKNPYTLFGSEQPLVSLSIGGETLDVDGMALKLNVVASMARPDEKHHGRVTWMVSGG